jgi:hypothetical protein
MFFHPWHFIERGIFEISRGFFELKMIGDQPSWGKKKQIYFMIAY